MEMFREHLEVERLADMFRTMEFRAGRDGPPGLPGMQPRTPGRYIPKAEPMFMGNPYEYVSSTATSCF